MSLHEPTRGGNRGGAGDFKWSDVVQDKHRDHYLGHTLNAPVGRWQKNKDITWYNKDKKGLNDEDAKREEMRALKEAEADAMSLALGFAPNYRPAGILAGDSSKKDETPEERAERKLAKEVRRQEREAKRAERDAKKRQRSRSPDRRDERRHRDYDERPSRDYDERRDEHRREDRRDDYRSRR